MVPDGVPVLHLDLDAEWAALCDPGPFAPQPMAAGEFANILYTSGSTGLPKGVPITHGGFLYALRGAAADIPQPWEARVMVAAPLYHMNALFWTELALMCGASVVLLSRFDARGYLTAAAGQRCTHLSGVPTMIALALRETDLLATLDLSSVQAIGVGSAPLSAEMMAEFRRAFPGAAISNGYGTTESGPLAFRPHPDGRPTPWPAMGVASDRVELKLVGGPSPDEGTLWVRSPVVTPGYLNLPQKTAERIRDGWYDTGDIMRRDAEGFYYFVGRADDMFTCGGENVYPGEVEAMLEAHPAIAQAAVVPVPDRIKGNLPAAFVVPAPGATLDAETVKAHALAEGPAYQHPRFVVIVDALPLSGTNKIDRKPLIEQAAAFSRDG
jgi:long-chain acyl-CoA synthetase